jgi:hypothetical protein
MPAEYQKVQCLHCNEFFGANVIKKHSLACVKPVKQKTCANCGEKFIGTRREQVTCSYSCSNTYFRSGSANGNWKQHRYRTTCFEYHKYKCVCCDESLIVEVHHLDGDKQNNDPRNLVPLCPTHHQYVHSRFAAKVIKKINAYVKAFKAKYKYQRL